MSDLQELIHTTSMHAYEQGVAHEQARILAILQKEVATFQRGTSFSYPKALAALAERIAAKP